MTCTWIDEAASLSAALERMGAVAEVAIDIEADGLYRYEAQMCTLQLASRTEVVVVDTLALDDLSPLGSLLSSDGPVKVIHDAAFDARILKAADLDLDRVFDTSVAARFLGDTATGLGALVEAHLDIHLSKGMQRADWGRRPIPPKAMRYLEQDVAHLIDLADALRTRVAKVGIVEEVAEECAHVLHRARTDPPDRRPAWQRVKGHEKLEPVGLAVLHEICLVRERVAQRLDVPPFKVVGNAELLEVARRRPHSTGEARKIKGLARGRAGRLVTDLVEAVRLGEAAGSVGPDASATAAPLPTERRRRKQRHKALVTWRKRVAAERGVHLQVVLPGHCLEHLVNHGASDAEQLRQVPGIAVCRVERDGAALLKILRQA